MTYEIKTYSAVEPNGHGERAVRIQVDQDDDDNKQYVTIHPWHRTHDSSVYVSVGWETPEGYDLMDSTESHQYMENSVMSRKEFVNALLEVFPELQRAEGS